MKHLKAAVIIFGITMVGEFLNTLLPLPVPAGVYGLFLLLFLLCGGLVKLEEVSGAGDFLLDIMPLLFIPAGAGLMTSVGAMREVLLPFVAVTVVSTFFVMIVTGKTAQKIIRRGQKERKKP